MASKTTLNAKNLESLGAPALAELLMEVSTGSAAAKRRLRLALAGGQGPKEAAAEVRKRLMTIAKSRARVGWRQRKSLTEDLAAQRRAIVDQIAPADPAEALALLWQFLTLANGIFDRCDDSSGTLMTLFRDACGQIGPMALAAQTPPDRLADRILDALMDDGYGQFDGLIASLTPALGAEGLAHLKSLVHALAEHSVITPPKSEWKKVGVGLGGAVYAHQLEDRHRRAMIDRALKDIADAQGDVDAFIAGHPPQARKLPAVATEIATRLLAAGRADEALATLDAASLDAWVPDDWQDARLAALEALNRPDQAQAFRWQCFSHSLAIPYLRAYLKRLPDFEDIEAEDRALALAAAYPNATLALWFLTNWPTLAAAAVLVSTRQAELDGDHYDILTPAAEALADRHPVAAVLVLRCMIDFTLTKGRASRYAHAARHLEECARLDVLIADYGLAEPHTAYLNHLRAQHPRKSSFWAEVA